MRLLRFLVLASASFFGFLFFVPTVTPAQQTVTINGTLTDPSEAAIVGAVVTAQPLDAAGANVHTESGPDGKYFAGTQSRTVPRPHSTSGVQNRGAGIHAQRRRLSYMGHSAST